MRKDFKSERNKKIIGIKKAKPSLTCADIALLYGISRQRVHAILHRNKRVRK